MLGTGLMCGPMTGLSQEKADVVGRAWSANLVAMSRVVLGQTLVVNKLVDLDWRFGGAYRRAPSRRHLRARGSRQGPHERRLGVPS